MRSENRYILAWRNMDARVVDMTKIAKLTYGYIRILEKEDVQYALYTLGDEDPQHSDNHKKYSKAKERMELREKSTSLPIPIKHLTNDPSIKKSKLIRWQKDVCKRIEKNTKCEGSEGIINVIMSQGRIGATTLVKALKRDNPDRYHIISGIHNIHKLDELVDYSSWVATDGTSLERVIIVDTEWVYYNDETDYNNFLSEVIGISSMYSCKNLWILTNYLPDIPDVESNRWDIYVVQGSYDTSVGSLLPIPYEQALRLQEESSKAVRLYREDQKLLIVYPGVHIPILALQCWITREAVSHNQGTVKNLRIWHNTGPVHSARCRCTYAILQLNATAARPYSYKRLDCIPNVRKLQSSIITEEQENVLAESLYASKLCRSDCTGHAKAEPDPPPEDCS
ncbi:Hypothetical protein POVR2_LOCUS270 [uncultured virus]|nr:Hypothetical protein POVR2_LOCUS270 [uncultured virus]